MPDHRGLFLSSDVSVRISKESLVIERSGSGLSMKIQVKDCANAEFSRWSRPAPTQLQPVSRNVLASDVSISIIRMLRNRLVKRIPCSGILPNGTPVVCNGANPDGTVDSDRAN